MNREKIQQLLDEVSNVSDWINKLPIPTTNASAKLMRLDNVMSILREELNVKININDPLIKAFEQWLVEQYGIPSKLGIHAMEGVYCDYSTTLALEKFKTDWSAAIKSMKDCENLI